MAKVLLYHFTDENRRKKVKAQLFRLAIPSREVRPEEELLPLGELLGQKNDAMEENVEAGVEPAALISEEMLVMHDLTSRQFHGLLDGMKKAGVSVGLKAVTTDTNLRWTSRQLYKELRAERKVMAAGGSGPLHEG